MTPLLTQPLRPAASLYVAPFECSRHSVSADYDRFGGRETPTVLRRNSLSGGGENSKRAVEELRQQLEITEVCACGSNYGYTLYVEQELSCNASRRGMATPLFAYAHQK